MTSIVIIVGGYFAALVVLALVARPYRIRMKALALELIESGIPEREERLIKRLMETAYSIRTSPQIFFVFMIGLARRSDQIDREVQEFVKNNALARDPRVSKLLDLHMASAAAVNPIFGALGYGAKWAFGLKAIAHHRGKRSVRSFPDMFEMKAALN